jgi:hypothetical protein
MEVDKKILIPLIVLLGLFGYDKFYKKDSVSNEYHPNWRIPQDNMPKKQIEPKVEPPKEEQPKVPPPSNNDDSCPGCKPKKRWFR